MTTTHTTPVCIVALAGAFFFLAESSAEGQVSVGVKTTNCQTWTVVWPGLNRGLFAKRGPRYVMVTGCPEHEGFPVVTYLDYNKGKSDVFPRLKSLNLQVPKQFHNRGHARALFLKFLRFHLNKKKNRWELLYLQRDWNERMKGRGGYNVCQQTIALFYDSNGFAVEADFDAKSPECKYATIEAPMLVK